MSEGILLLTCLLEVLFPPSYVVQSHVFSHACGTRIPGIFAMVVMLQAEAADTM